jgi:hypothetical protein
MYDILVILAYFLVLYEDLRYIKVSEEQYV